MRITRETTRAGKTTSEVAFAISSKKRSSLSASDALAIIRAHWSIEVRLHWIRDVVFGEDACRVRSRSAPQILASLRNAAVTRLHLTSVGSLTEELERLASKPHRAIDYVVRPSSRRQD
jgi:predicted transposase YbfD/YdcC